MVRVQVYLLSGTFDAMERAIVYEAPDLEAGYTIAHEIVGQGIVFGGKPNYPLQPTTDGRHLVFSPYNIAMIRIEEVTEPLPEVLLRPARADA